MFEKLKGFRKTLFHFELFSFVYFEDDLYIQVAEVMINDYDGSLLYISKWAGKWQFEILYCRACYRKLVEWVRSIKRET
jgi:hypothetical protein